MPYSQSKYIQQTEIKLLELVPSAPTEYTLARAFPPENYRNFEFNGKLYSSVWPERIDLLSPKEQEELRNAPWFQAGLPRKLSLEILLQQPPGSFLVRQSESQKRCFVLSLRINPPEPPRLAHYLIEKSPKGYMIKGFPKVFSTLTSLVVHHSVLKEQLPVELLLSRSRSMRNCGLVSDKGGQMETEVMTSPTTTLCCRVKR